MIMIVGLGNIGPKYQFTRHNIGFMILDHWTNSENSSGWTEESSRQALTQKATISGQDALLVKPTTMMNLSGKAVSKLAQFYRIAPEDIWVVYDELDLPLGRLKIVTDASDNGHNGLISISQSLGHNRFWRFKVGVDSRVHREVPGLEYVLQPFEGDQTILVGQSVEQAVEALKCALGSGLELAQQRYNKSAAIAAE